MDVNGDGSVDQEELRATMGQMGLPCSKKHVAAIMSQFRRPARARGMLREPSTGGTSTSISWEQFKHYVHTRDHQIDTAFE